MRFLFYCRNTTGLGHLMRGRSIAQAVRQLAPSAEIVFTGNPGSVAPVLGDFPYVPDVSYEELARLRPDAVVIDTLFPKWDVPADIPIVYVMRKIRAESRDRLLSHPLLLRAALILIPHVREEYPDELPSQLRHKTWWIGPVVRLPNVAVQRTLRERYRLLDDEFVVTSTAGGGGREESAFFFDTVVNLHGLLHAAVPRLRHLLFAGPYCKSALPVLDGLTALRFEPALNDLFALSHLVIAEGGYNTVNEVRLAQAPAVFLPSARTHDDQEERVRALERQGLCAVFTERSRDPVGEILRVCLSGSCLERMRSSYRNDRFESGNLNAARQLIALVTRTRRESSDATRLTREPC